MRSVGPLVSLVIGVLFVALAAGAGLPNALDGVAAWLGYTNLILLAFNLLPALPLDGGACSTPFSGTRGVTSPGRHGSPPGPDEDSGFLFIALGLAMLIFEGTFSGAWLAFVGWFCSRRRPRRATSRRSRLSKEFGYATS